MTMKILLFANQNWGKLCVERLLAEGEQIVGLITDEPEGQQSWYSSMWEVGKKYGLPVRHSLRIKDEKEVIAGFAPDLIVSIGFRQIFPAEIIRLPSKGCINLHGSLLPKYRGHAPLNWAIIHGEKETGVTVHYINEGVDTGDIIVQEAVPIYDFDTALEVYERALLLYPKLLSEAIRLIKKNQVQPIKQRPEEGFYCCRRYPKDSQINWERQTALEVHNFVRALSGPYPHAFTYYKGKKILITKSSLPQKIFLGPPGRVGYKIKDQVIVLCKDRGLQIEKIKLEEGEKLAPAAIFTVGDDVGTAQNR